MKVEYNEHDMDYINRVNDQVNNKSDEQIPIIINDDSYYFIKFKATDYGKANNFALLLLGPTDVCNELRESLGISVDSVYISDPDNKKKEIADYLRSVANELEGMR